MGNLLFAPTANAAPPTITYDTSNFTYADASTERIYLNTPQLLNIEINFTEATHNTVVTFKVPKTMSATVPVISTNGGVSIVANYTKDTSSDTDNNLHIFELVDGTLGSYNITTKVEFRLNDGYTNQIEALNTAITKNGTQESSADLQMKSYVDSRIYTHGAGPSAIKYANGVPTQYNIVYQNQGRKYGSSTYHFYNYGIDMPDTSYTDVEMRIKLPPQATYISGHYAYDSANHEIYHHVSPFYTYRHETNLLLSFSGMAIGDQIQWPNDHVWPNGQTGAIQITGKEGGVVSKSFTYDLLWPNAYIEAPELLLTENSTTIKEPLARGQENQEIICTNLKNKGTMDATNVGVRYDFPTGIKTHGVFVPSSTYANTDGNISLEYTTNTNQTRTVPLPNLSTYYNQSSLGLLSGEYITSATLKVDTFKPSEYIYQRINYMSQGLCLFGDVDTTLDESVPLTVTTTANGSQILNRNVPLSYTGTQHTDMHMSHWVNKKVINPGEIIAFRGGIDIRSNFYYHNGSYAENPTVFMFIPEGFTPLTGSLQISHVDGYTPLQYVNTQSGMQIYKTTLQKKWYRYDRFSPAGNDNAAVHVDMDIQADITLAEGGYDFRKILMIGSESEVFRIAPGYGATLVPDTWNLLSVSSPHLLYPTYNGFTIPTIHVNRSTFTLQDTVQSAEDTSPVSSYNTNNTNHSLYHDSTTGSLQVNIYNAQTTAVSNFTYGIALPRIGDNYNPDTSGSGSEWEPTLTSLPDVSHIPGASLLYSTDGTTFVPSITPIADIKYIQLIIPSIPSQANYTMSIPLTAPSIPSSNNYQQTAWLRSGYQMSGSTQYDLGTKKLMLTDNIPASGTITSSTSSGTWTNTGTILTLTTDEPIETPTGWTAVPGSNGTQFTRTITSNGTTNITLTDQSGNTSTTSYNVTNVDTNPPNIILNGSSPQDTHLGAPYTDPGVNCNDTENSCTITSTGTVDTSTPGIYTITYTATDEAGNTNSIQRTVNVVDITQPIITLQGSNPLEVAQGTSYTDPGATCSDDVSCTLTQTGTVDTSTLGVYTITYTATDTSNNTVTTTREVHVVDRTNPTLTLNAPASVITIQKGEPFIDPGYTCTDNVHCAVTIQGTVDTNQASEYTLIYTATDPAGNTVVKKRIVRVEGSNNTNDTDNEGQRVNSNTGPGGGYDPEREPDTPKEGTILKKVWETVNLIKAVNTVNDGNAKDVILEGQCKSLITDIDNLKTKALYYGTFINNSTQEYTDNYITFGQFKRTLTKYESLLSNIPTQEQSIQTVLQSINKNMSEKIDRQMATKMLVQGIQKRYSSNLFVSTVPSQDKIHTFQDNINPTTAPYIQKAYDLCLVHGTNTKNGEPLNGEERRFEPKRNITIAETIKILINMSHSWDKIKGLIND